MTYIAPSECAQCVPVEQESAVSSFLWRIDVSHELECPNYPYKDALYERIFDAKIEGIEQTSERRQRQCQ